MRRLYVFYTRAELGSARGRDNFGLVESLAHDERHYRLKDFCASKLVDFVAAENGMKLGQGSAKDFGRVAHRAAYGKAFRANYESVRGHDVQVEVTTLHAVFVRAFGLESVFHRGLHTYRLSINSISNPTDSVNYKMKKDAILAPLISLAFISAVSAYGLQIVKKRRGVLPIGFRHIQGEVDFKSRLAHGYFAVYRGEVFMTQCRL
jgi:hypothetical protein